MASLAWITSCRQSACGLARALVAGYLLDSPPADTSPEALHDVAPELTTLFNWGRVVPLEEPRPYLVRTHLLPGTEVVQHYRAVTGKVVYVARDPRGIVAELIRGSRVGPEVVQQRVRQLIASPDEVVGDSDEANLNWQLHAREWTVPERVRAHFPDLDDVCVIRHEDMVRDPGATLGQILGFLEVPAGVDEERIRRTVQQWTLPNILATDLFDLPPGMRAFRAAPPLRDDRRPEPSAVVDVEPALEAAFQERIRVDAEFAALVKQFGYTD
ncbi:sulfotransferase domain-containing protein [Plantactinospora soyae]|uniref:Sulfotransferase domain-containing protein n=1 Tax=Plantactinospora soyae TaxID=1544732 RepID=A0A927M8T0_9ACTN|nr:sulfotransferase domain-containing protein [Plantactinospora soyae]MBE1489177.1 hypothetical protein [Plantactinospora soyae]